LADCTRAGCTSSAPQSKSEKIVGVESLGFIGMTPDGGDVDRQG